MPGRNPLKVLSLLRSRARGKLSYGEMGRQMQITVSRTDISGGYGGHARGLGDGLALAHEPAGKEEGHRAVPPLRRRARVARVRRARGLDQQDLRALLRLNVAFDILNKTFLPFTRIGKIR